MRRDSFLGTSVELVYPLAPKRMKHTKKLYLILSLAFITIAVSGFTLWKHRMELFVIPQKWEKITKLREEITQAEALESEVADKKYINLANTLRELVEIQMDQPLPNSCEFTLIPTQGVDGSSFFTLFHSLEDIDIEPGNRYSSIPDWYQLNLLVLDSKGFVSGNSSLFSQVVEIAALDFYQPSNETFSIFTSDHRFIFSVDSKGIVPLGFAVVAIEMDAKTNRESITIFPSLIDKDEDLLDWIKRLTSENSRPKLDSSYFSESTALKLLRSKKIGDQHRGLFRLELLGKSVAYHALELVDSKNDYLRARAAIIAARDFSLSNKLVHKLDKDSCLYLREGLALALIYSTEANVAQRAWVYLLNLEDNYRYDFLLPVRKLTSPKVAGALVKRIEKKLRAGDYDEVHRITSYLIAMKASDLKNHSEGLHSLWNKIQEALPEKTESPDLEWSLHHLAWCISQLNDDRSIELILKNLESTDFISDITAESLAATHHNIEELKTKLTELSSANKDPHIALFATIALAKRGDKRSLEILKKNIVDPNMIWIDLTLSDPIYIVSYSYDETKNESNRTSEYDEHNYFHSPFPHPFSYYAPKEIIPFLVETAVSNKNNIGFKLFNILLDIPSPKYRPYIEKIVQRWLSGESTPPAKEEFFQFLINLREEWADELVVKISSTFINDKKLLSIVFSDYLSHLKKQPSKQKIELLSTVAHSSNHAPEKSDSIDKISSEDLIDIDEEIFKNLSLTASIILIRWNVRGETAQLFKKLKRPSNQWIHSVLFEEYAPRSFELHLKDLIKINPSKFKERCEEILSWRRSLNWSTSAFLR